MEDKENIKRAFDTSGIINKQIQCEQVKENLNEGKVHLIKFIRVIDNNFRFSNENKNNIIQEYTGCNNKDSKILIAREFEIHKEFNTEEERDEHSNGAEA